MPEPWEWGEEDLQALVTQQASESLNLDFKECRALDVSSPKTREKSKADLSKDVSAFANSAGGTLVYGITEDKKTHTASKLDVGYDPSVITQEWIDQVINSTIQPRISGTRINPVKLASTSPGKVAYVVHTPQSATAHQASDKRYYKRFNFQSVPMEDYGIRDVIQRVRAPNVTIEIEINNSTSDTFDFQWHDGVLLSTPGINIFAVCDEASDIAEYSLHRVYLPHRLKIHSQVKFEESRTEIAWGSDSSRYSYLQFRLAPSEPLFPGERRLLQTIQFDIQANSRLSLMPFPWILWQSRAARAPKPTEGAVLFEVILPPDTWKFRPVTIEELADLNYTVEFRP